ncbi:MAG: SBBP repeat-containing protein [Acidobacteriota bacterium]|nr:SBBP repeat-containing protein [Acidobacteriota bacterium]
MKNHVSIFLLAGSVLLLTGCNSSSHSSSNTGNTGSSSTLTFTAGSSFLFATEFGTNTWDATTRQGDTVSGVAQDSLNNVYVAGYTAGNLPGYTVPEGVLKGVVFQLTGTGSLVWGRELTTGAGDTIDGMVNVGSNVIVAGTTYGAYPTFSNPGGISEIFLGNFDVDGGLIWLYQYPSTSNISVESVTGDSSGNIIVGGEIADGANGEDLYISKFDSNGNQLWFMTFGSGALDGINSVTTDKSGNIYATGFTSGVFPGSAGTTTSMPFVGEFSATTGANIWIQQSNTVPGLVGFTPTVITATTDGQLFLEGQTGTFPTSAQIEVMKMSSSAGTIAWSYNFGAGTQNLPGQGIVADSSDNLYVAGLTTGALVTGATAGVDDVFLAKLSSSGTAVWAQQLGTGKEGSRVTPSTSTPIYLNLGSQGIALAGMTYGQFSGFSNPNEYAELFAAEYGPK